MNDCSRISEIGSDETDHRDVGQRSRRGRPFSRRRQKRRLQKHRDQETGLRIPNQVWSLTDDFSGCFFVKNH